MIDHLSINPRHKVQILKYTLSFLSICFYGMTLYLLKISGIAEKNSFLLISFLFSAIIGLFLFIQNLEVLLAFIAALLPFTRGVFQFEIGVVTFSPFTIGLIGVVLLTAPKLIYRQYRSRIDIVDINIIFVGIFYLFSTLTAEDILSVGLVAFHALFIPICAYFTMRISIDSYRFSKIVISGFIVGATIFACIHIMFSFISGERIVVLGVPAISIATLMIFPVVFFYITGNIGRLKGFLLGSPTLLSFLLCFSRTYIVGIIVSPLLYKLSRYGKGTHLFISLLLVSLIATIFTSLAANPHSSTYLGFKLPSSSTQREEIKAAEKSADRLTSGSHLISALYGRALAQKYALREFMASPLLGTGIRPKEAGLATQHNFHIEWLQYGGVIGYLLYAGVFVGFFRRTRIQAKEDKVTAALQVSILILLTNSLTNGIMHGYMPTVIFTLMGIARSRSQLSTT